MIVVIVNVAYDGPEMLDIENVAFSPLDMLHIHSSGDASVASMSGSHTRSLLAQQRKPRSHGDDDDDDDDDDGSVDNCHVGDVTLHADDRSLVRSGN